MGTLQLFSSYFINEAADGHKPKAGDLYWVPVSEIREVPFIMDVKRASPEEHIATRFEIMEISTKHFRARDRLPIHKLKLDDTQELIVNRAKKRICVLLNDAPKVDLEEIKSAEQRRLARTTFNARHYLLAPTYSVSLPSKQTSYGPELVARIRALQYLHLHCLPNHENTANPGSIVRLDHAFHACLGRGCEYSGRSLHPELFELVSSQLAALIGGPGGELFNTVQEIVAESLPEIT